MLECLLPLVILFLAAYPLARALNLSWSPRVLVSGTLGIVGGPAIAWITGVMLPAIRPDLPLMLLGGVGAGLFLGDLRRSPRPNLKPSRDQALLVTIMAGVTAYQCMVLVGTHWDRGSLVIANLYAHDVLWHLAISAMLRPGADFQTPWPPPNPVWSDAPLTNYHPLTDVLVALLSPHNRQITAYFHILPPLYGLVFTASIAWVARQWGASYRGAALAVLLAGLCGSLGHLVALLSGGPVVWDSAFWLSQPWSMLNNPPLALSYGALLLGLAVLSCNQAPLPARSLSLFFLWGTSFGIKAYLPALVIPALATAALLAPNKDRRDLFIQLGSVVVGAVLMLCLTTRGAAGLMDYDPGWVLTKMLAQTDRLGDLTTRTLMAASDQIRPVVVFAWFAASLPLFIFGNLGIRVVGLRSAWRGVTGREEVAPATLTAQRTAFGVCVLGMLLPVLFKQKGVEWNTIQFGYYPLVLTCLWAAPVIRGWISASSQKWQAAALGVGVAVLAFPTTLQMLSLSDSGTIIPANEISALLELQKQVPVGGTIAVEPGVILSRTTTEQRGFHPNNEPVSSALVPAITGRPVYYADPLTLQILLLPGEKRLSELKRGLSLSDPERKRWLADRKIDAVYYLPQE